MPEVRIEVAGVDELLAEVQRLSSAVEATLHAGVLTREWYTAREACELKGVPYNTLRLPAFVHLLPNFGRPTAVLEAGRCRHMYHRSDVAAWLPRTQAEIERVIAARDAAREEK